MKRLLSIAFLLVSVPAFAQTASAPQGQAPADPLSTFLKTGFTTNKGYLVKSAEKMTEADFSFKPAGTAAEVRTFGQILGHLANANYAYCSRAKGEPNPNKQDFEKTTSKADLIKALNDAFAYCDGVYGSMSDSKLMQMMTVQGPNNTTRQIVAAQPLIANLAHNNEHYGNLVTYMRAKGIVPPSSERGAM
jgi:uncharacterized damage-inducible protein DinB